MGMPHYFLRLRTPDQVTHHSDKHEVTSFNEAIAVANRAALALIRNRVRRGVTGPRGVLDVEDENRRPVARILLTELAQQIS
jgi:hypothetical protein